MDACRNSSMNIVDRYNGLKNIVSVYGEDSSQFSIEIKEILKLVMDEYKLYDDLKYPKNEIIQETTRLEKYGNISGDNLLMYRLRVLQKLNATSAMLDEEYFNMIELLPNNNIVPNDIKLGLPDVMCSCLEIESLKKIDKLIHDVSQIECLDRMFIADVKNEHFDTKIHYFTTRFTSEILALYYDFDCGKIPNFNYKMFMMAINNRYGLVSERINYNCDEALKQMALCAFEILSSLDNVCDNASTYYQYVLYFGFIETYVSYMSDNKRKELSGEIQKFTIKDDLIRKRMKKILSNKR